MLLAVAVVAATGDQPSWPPFLPSRDSFSADLAANVERAWSDPTLTRTVRGRPAAVPLPIYIGFVDTPDVTTAAARFRHLAQYQVRALDEDWYVADDHDGSHGLYRVLARVPGRRVMLSWGEHTGRILGTIIWGADNDTLEGVVGDMLDARGLTLATMESCTSGLLASTITDVTGAAQYYKGGFVAYSTQMKMGLGVSADIIEQYGVISAEVAGAMAAAARRDLDADYAIGITGIAGNDEVEGKPPGTMHIAVAGEFGADNISYTFYQGRQATKRRAVTTALFLLRRTLLAQAG